MDVTRFGTVEGQRLRFPRRQRLRRRDFDEVFEKGRSFFGQLLVLRLLPRNVSGYRLGVVVSRRLLRRAVDRNRARRLVREVFRLRQHRFRGGGDMVIIVRERMARATRGEVEEALLRMARHAGVLEES